MWNQRGISLALLVLDIHMLQVQGDWKKAGMGGGWTSAQTANPLIRAFLQATEAGDRVGSRMGLGSPGSSAGSTTQQLPNSSFPVCQAKARTAT